MSTATYVVSNGIDPTKLWDEIVEGRGDINYLKEIAGDLADSVVDAVTSSIKYLKEINLEKIVGGAKALWENLSKGNFNFLKNWATDEDTPLIAKAAGVGGIILGGVAAGKAAIAAGGKIAATSFGKFVIQSGLGYTFTREEFLTKSFNFVETALEVDFNQSTDEFFEESVKRLQELAKSIGTDLISTAGRSLARVIVDQVGKPYLEINRRMLGILSLTMSEEIMEDIESSLASIGSQLWDLLKDVASRGVLLMGRDVLVNWGIIPAPNDKEEFTLSGYLEKKTKAFLSAKDVPDWLQEGIIEGGRDTFNEFREKLIEGGGIIDEARMQVRFRNT